MALAEVFNGSAVSISTTEISLTGGTSTLQSQTTPGIYQLFLDLTNMGALDVFQLTIYEKILSGGSKRIVQQVNLTGVAVEAAYTTPALELMWGWEYTLKKLRGTDRAFDWSIRS